MKKPIYFLILKIVGFCAVVMAAVGIVLSIIGFGDFESNKFMIGGILACVGIFAAAPCLIFGFSPEISKAQARTQKYVLNENKEDLKDIASNIADIQSEAIKKNAAAVKEGFQKDKIFCKHCGASIDADSKFCQKCGKEQ